MIFGSGSAFLILDAAAAAEDVAAPLREAGLATVVGQQTVGEGRFQVVYSLLDGSGVGLSIGKYFTPGGVNMQDEGGLVPDVTVEVDEDTYTAIRAATLSPADDPQVQAALEVLKG